MLKNRVILAIAVCLATGSLFAQQTKAPLAQKNSVEQKETLDPTCFHDCHITTESAKGDENSPSFLASFARPDGMLVIVGIITFCFVGWQSWATQQAANATSKGVQAQMDANRAWIMGTLGKMPDWNPTETTLEFMEVGPVFRNYGDTPGKILNVQMRVQYLADKEQLDEIPTYKGEQWYTSGFDGEIDLMPRDMSVRPASLKLSGLTFPNVTKGALSLFIYWVVNYNDAYGRGWHTRSCYKYHVPSGFDSMTEGYYIGGPHEYNRSGKGYYRHSAPS
jgi:hypothetical protein